MEQFTASEVRDLAKRGTDAMQQFIDRRHTLHVPPQPDDADMVIAECLRAMDAYADMLEARERAALATHSAQAQPPAASVPTMRYFIGGPRACAYVDKFEHVEAVITALCKCTGDARDDYTSTDLLASERVR